MTNWTIGIDWDRDGFICWDARPGDALNKLPSPLYYAGIDIGTDTSVVELQSEETVYGLRKFHVQTGVGEFSGLRLGLDGEWGIGETHIDDIPVEASTQYTATFWVKRVDGDAGVDFNFLAFDQNFVLLGLKSEITLTEDWVQHSFSFTTLSDSTHIMLPFLKDDNPADVTFEVAGLMLVEGNNTAPNGYNVGNSTNGYDNITNRILSAEWFLGMRNPYRNTADDSTLDLILNNFDKLFSPENTASPVAEVIKPLRPVRVRSVNGTEARTHWFGWLERVEPEANRYGKRHARLVAMGPMQFYKATQTKLELQENKRTDEIIAELIKEVIVPPAFSRAWILNRVGNSELGSSTYLATTSSYSTLDKGKLTLNIAAENWVQQGGYTDSIRDTFDVYRAIGDITAAEHGKFLFSREGKALFWNRHHLLLGLDPEPAAILDDGMTELQYTFAGMEQTKNEIIVICHPREISESSDHVLWELGDAIIRVEAGKTREIYVKYEDENDQRIGAKDVTVDDVEFEEGTATATVEAKANGAELTFTNSGTVTAIVKKCTLKGRKITDAGIMEAKAIDAGSIVDYGRRTMRVNLPSIDNLENAQYIADFERNRRAQPRGEVTAVTVHSDGQNGGDHHEQQLARTLGDMIQLNETQTGHDKNYYIVGEFHELTAGATLWKTVWYLEPAPAQYPWKLTETADELIESTEDLARTVLGESTRLAY